MLLFEHGIGLNTPSDLINRCSPSFIFSFSFLARAIAAQMTFSISVNYIAYSEFSKLNFLFSFVFMRDNCRLIV